MKRLILFGALAILIVLPARSFAQDETNSQLFLAPEDVPYQQYTPDNITSGGTVTFNASQVPGATSLTDVQILPELNPDPNTSDGDYPNSDLDAINSSDYSSYFAETPNVDYDTTTPSAGSSLATFNTPGIYFAQLDTNNGSTIVEVNVDDENAEDPAAGAGDKLGPQRKIATPNTDLVLISSGDPKDNGAMANAMAQNLPNAQNVNSVAAVVTAIMNACKAAGHKVSVTLIGHGRPGSIKIGNQRINDQGDQNGGMTSAQFQAAIDMCCSSITFYSCSTGQGPSGTSFLQNIAGSIGSASGWTNTITIATTYFDANANAMFVTYVPEPVLFAPIVIGMALLRRSRRRAA